MNTPASPDRTLAAWLKDVFAPKPDREYFSRLARSVAASAAEPCPTCG